MQRCWPYTAQVRFSFAMPTVLPQLANVLATLALLVAALATLLVAGSTGGWFGRVPQGEAAMGLVVVLAAAVVAALLTIFAAWLAAMAGRLDWLGARSAWWASGAGLAVGGAAVVAFFAWAEGMQGWARPASILAGGVLPLLLQGWLLRALWRADLPASAERMLVTAASLAALLIGGLLLIGLMAKVLARAEGGRRAAADVATRAATEQARRRALTPAERLREDYAGFSPGAPLWVFVGTLADPVDDEVRAVVVERAQRVPDFERELVDTLVARFPRYRHGALVLLRSLPASRRPAAIGAALAASTRLAAEEVREGDWLIARREAQPDPIGHLRALVGAAHACGPDAEVDAALAELREAIGSYPDAAIRDRALAALDGD